MQPLALPDDFYGIPVKLAARLVGMIENTLRSYMARGYVKCTLTPDTGDFEHTFDRADMIRLHHFKELIDLGMKPSDAGRYVNTFFDFVEENRVLTAPVKYIVFNRRTGPHNWVYEHEGATGLDKHLPGIVSDHEAVVRSVDRDWQHGPRHLWNLFWGRRDDATKSES